MGEEANTERRVEGSVAAPWSNLLAEETPPNRDELLLFDELRRYDGMLADEVIGFDEQRDYERMAAADLFGGYEAAEGDMDGEWLEKLYRYGAEHPFDLQPLAEFGTKDDEFEQTGTAYVKDDDDGGGGGGGRTAISKRIKHVEKLRLEHDILLERRTNVMKMLVELYEKDLVGDAAGFRINPTHGWKIFRKNLTSWTVYQGYRHFFRVLFMYLPFSFRAFVSVRTNEDTPTVYIPRTRGRAKARVFLSRTGRLLTVSDRSCFPSFRPFSLDSP